MCTLTWTRRADGYELFFNRDELKTRQPALAPALPTVGAPGVRYLAPTDPDGGGTWLGVNDHGLSVGLLNGWRPRDRLEGDFTSRGLLVAALLGCRSSAEVADTVLGRPLNEFRSFALVALEPGQRLLRVTWDGDELDVERLEDLEQPISSSSRDPEGAAKSRRRVFEGLADGALPSADQLRRFHASHDPDPGARSACMHRDDAETVSHTRILVDGLAVELRYQAGAPCLAGPTQTLQLPRADVPAASAGR